MAIIHEKTGEVILKVVYHGAGRSGKTTNLLYLNGHLPAGSRGRFVTLETPTERTLFFDLLPVRGGDGAARFRFLLFATPGQEYYHASRKLVLKGADAVVLVVDSQRDRLQDNWESLELLERNLKELGQTAESLPLVIQYNKRDLASALSLEDLERRFNPRRTLSVPAVARTGQGVPETFLEACRLSLGRLRLPGTQARRGPLFRSVVVSEDDATALERHLARLTVEAGAAGALLVDESSAILAAAGRTPTGDREALAALLACNFTAAEELSHSLGGAGFAGTVQWGERWLLKASRVDDRRFLVLVCGRDADMAKLRGAATLGRTVLAGALQELDRVSERRLAAAVDVVLAAADAAFATLEGRAS